MDPSIDVLKTLVEKLTARTASRLPSTWATLYRILNGKNWSFNGREYLRKIHDCDAHRVVVPKGAQLGLTETLINRALYSLDIENADTLYLFPTTDDASAFSSGRLATAIDESSHIGKLFTNINNVKHKLAGSVNFYCRGSNSRSGLKSIPVKRLFIDEFDEMLPAMLALVRERLTGARDPKEWDISTPTLPHAGIWAEWLLSRQHFWFVICPFCGKDQTIDWPENVVWSGDEKHVEASLCCRFCKRLWPEKEKEKLIDSGCWRCVANEGADTFGFNISQLYSITEKIDRIVLLSLRTEEYYRVEFFNSKMGRPYIPVGTILDSSLVIEAAHTDLQYNVYVRANTSCMGVDVSPTGLHWIEIAEMSSQGVKVVLNALQAPWEELPKLMETYSVRCCVVDASPERTNARALAEMSQGSVFLAFYPEGMKTLYTVHEENYVVSIDRTEALERVQARFKKKTVVLPCNLPLLKTYAEHLTSPVKTFKASRTGLPIARYVNTGPDHFAHASVYCEIALLLCPTASWTPNIHSPIGNITEKPGPLFFH